MIFFENPPAEWSVKSMEQKTESFVKLMSKNSISGNLAQTLSPPLKCPLVSPLVVILGDDVLHLGLVLEHRFHVLLGLPHLLAGEFFFIFSSSMYCIQVIQHCFICRPSDPTVSEDAGIEPRTVATSVLAVRR
jgi:hypothetical protein